MRFLVFLPFSGGLRSSFESVGLECLTGQDEPAPDNADLDSFPPSGTAGRIYGWPVGMDGLPSYQPENQTWIAAAPDPDRGLQGKRYWLGVWNDLPPTSFDLARTQQVDGRMQLKSPAGMWQVPSLLNLPCSIELDDSTGRPKRVAKPEHARWRKDCDWGTKLALRLIRGEAVDFPIDEAFEVAVRLLQLNYRLPRELVHRLGLLSDEHVLKAILAHAADSEEIKAAVAEMDAKKNASPPTPDSSGSNAGNAG